MIMRMRKHLFLLPITGETTIKSLSVTSRSLRTSIKKITTCANNLTHSCPVLQATCETIHEICIALKGIRSHAMGIAALKLNAIQSLDNLEANWVELSSLLADNQPLKYSIIIQIAIFLGAFITGVIGVSQNDRDFTMGILNILLFQAVQPLDRGLLDSCHKDFISQMPSNIHAALLKFDLDNKTVIYAICPKYHCTYAPLISPGDTVAKYPSHCTNCTDPSSNQCGQPQLRHDGTGKENSWKPIKPFVYHSFHDYLAGLLSWKDLEEAIDKACDELQGLIDGLLPSFALGVWQAEFLQSFQGPTPGQFVVNRGNRGHYIFSLNFDTFNVESMCIQGALAACGLILMVCLNLPPHLHYKLEYIYIAGIIPGHKQPMEMELNHYFRPLVNDMEQSWKLGVRYTATASFPEGRIMQSAIAIAVMDLPAAQHSSQLVGHLANIYCTICKCCQRSTLGRINHYNWELQDDEEIHQHTEEWRDVATLKGFESIFNKHSTCYSELWQLPYWKPTHQLVFNPMHCNYKTLIPVHFWWILLLTSADAATPIPPTPAFSHNFVTIDENNATSNDMNRTEVKQVSAIHRLLTEVLEGTIGEARLASLQKHLMDKNTKALVFVCNDLQLHPAPKFATSTRLYKNNWVSALVKWVGLHAYH